MRSPLPDTGAGWLVAYEREQHASRIHARRSCIPGATRQGDSRSRTNAAHPHDQDQMGLRTVCLSGPAIKLPVINRLSTPAVAPGIGLFPRTMPAELDNQRGDYSAELASGKIIP